MRHISYTVNGEEVTTPKSNSAEADYKVLARGLKNLADKFKSVEGFTVDFYDDRTDLKTVSRICSLKVTYNGSEFINSIITLWDLDAEL